MSERIQDTIETYKASVEVASIIWHGGDYHIPPELIKLSSPDLVDRALLDMDARYTEGLPIAETALNQCFTERTLPMSESSSDTSVDGYRFNWA